MLFNQFKYFFNLYFLLLACSQFVPELRLGALYTYWVPLVCRLSQFSHMSINQSHFSYLCISVFIWWRCAGISHKLSYHSTHVWERGLLFSTVEKNTCFWFWRFTLQGLVLIITIMREAVEEIRCYLRDKEVNSQIYSKLSTRGEAMFCLCWYLNHVAYFSASASINCRRLVLLKLIGARGNGG